MYGLTFEKSLKMFGNTDLADKLEFQEKRIAELTHALNELYAASIGLYDHLSEVQCNKGLEKGLFKAYVIAVSKADKILEGN